MTMGFQVLSIDNRHLKTWKRMRECSPNWLKLCESLSNYEVIKLQDSVISTCKFCRAILTVWLIFEFPSVREEIHGQILIMLHLKIEILLDSKEIDEYYRQKNYSGLKGWSFIFRHKHLSRQFIRHISLLWFSGIHTIDY